MWTGEPLRRPRDEQEWDALLGLMAQAFTMPDDGRPRYRAQVGDAGFRVVGDRNGIAGTLALFDLGQFYGGRPVAMGGVAAVAVAPHVRGQGVGRAMMVGILRELREAGTPLSALYASTQVPYRRVGYEVAGSRNVTRYPLARLKTRDRPLPVRPVDPGDVATLAPLYERWAAGIPGMLQRSAGVWSRASLGESLHGVLFGPTDNPAGYLTWQQSRNDRGGYDLFLRERVFLTPAAAAQAWTVLADHRSMADMLYFIGPASDPWLALPAESWFAEVTRQERWMLRLVDVAAAFADRGWPAGQAGELELEISDALLPENAGRWILSVEGGEGRLTAGGSGALAIDIGALATLYSGIWTARELRDLGWLTGSEADFDTADRLFSGPEPWMIDHF